MLIRIDPQSPDPIFEQIAFQIKGAVARGDLSDGDKLPSVRELAKDVSVNPNTVIRSYEVLEREGVILRRQGSGCFITGKTSMLNDDERKRQLSLLMRRTVTEAYHLGFSSEDIRKSLDVGLRGVHFRKEKRKK